MRIIHHPSAPVGVSWSEVEAGALCSPVLSSRIYRKVGNACMLVGYSDGAPTTYPPTGWVMCNAPRGHFVLVDAQGQPIAPEARGLGGTMRPPTPTGVRPWSCDRVGHPIWWADPGPVDPPMCPECGSPQRWPADDHAEEQGVTLLTAAISLAHALAVQTLDSDGVEGWVERRSKARQLLPMIDALKETP